MKKILMLFDMALVSLMFFVGCTKKDEAQIDPAPSSSIPRIATVTCHFKNGKVEIDSHQYDNLGRLIKVSAGDWYETFEYSESKVTIKDYDDEGWFGISIYHLNAKGLVNASSWEEFGGGFNYKSNDTYEYDNEGFLKTKQSSNAQGTINGKNTYTVINGNTTIDTYDGIDSDSKYSTQHQFFTDKMNTVGYENLDFPFFGKQNKNPVKESKTTNSDGTVTITNFTYEYDSKGRIIKQTGDLDNDFLYTVYTYVE